MTAGAPAATTNLLVVGQWGRDVAGGDCDARITTTFRNDGTSRSNKKQDVMQDVLDLLKKLEEGGTSARERALHAMVVQQNTIEASLTMLLTRKVAL